MLQVVNWIALGDANPAPEPVPFGGDPPLELVEAVAARVARQPWKPSRHTCRRPAWSYRAWARRLIKSVEDEGGAARSALDQLRGAQQWAAIGQRTASEGVAELNRALAFGELVAEGRPSERHAMPASHKPYESIPAAMIDGRRAVDLFGWCCIQDNGNNFDDWVHDPGPFFYEVRFRISDVQKVWPRSAPGLPAVTPIYRTGAPGRDTSRHIVELEMRRRAGADLLKSSLAAEADELAAWLKEKHPGAAPMGAKSIRNVLGLVFRELNASRPK